MAKPSRYTDSANCHYCKRPMLDPKTTMSAEEKAKARTVDHVVPRADGGSDDPSNLVWACGRCNCLRGTMPYEAFEEFARVIIRKFTNVPTPLLRAALIRYTMLLVSFAISNNKALKTSITVSLLELSQNIERYENTGKTKPKKVRSNVKH